MAVWESPALRRTAEDSGQAQLLTGPDLCALCVLCGNGPADVIRATPLRFAVRVAHRAGRRNSFCANGLRIEIVV